MDNVKKLELTITALKQSLANKVADYEGQLAEIRAEASILLEDQGKRIVELEEQLRESDVKETENEDVAVSS